MKTVGGGDAAFGQTYAYGAMVILSLPDLTLVDFGVAKTKITSPYIPGQFARREGPPLRAAYRKLKIKPDCLILEGQGIAHPAGDGLACVVGRWFNRPTIGCAKSKLVGEYNHPGKKRGDFSPLVYRHTVVGSVLVTRDRTKPVFVSPGNKITLENARRIVLETCRGYRLPEPVRLAHQLATKFKKLNHR